MEDRVADRTTDRPGAALFALAAIVLVTAAWWALALWPVGSVEPEWLARTRSACFGSHGGGLPDAGGWILLIGEPLGMLTVLAALWGKSLRQNFRWAWQHAPWRIGTMLTLVAGIAFFASLGMRVARAQSSTHVEFATSSGITTSTNVQAPSASLVDQHGDSIELSSMHGSPTILTFAYGHCSTVCPSIVSDLRRVREDARKSNVRIVILTLDPWRDVPERLPTLATYWKLDGDDLVLSGSVNDVESTLDALAIGRRRNETTGDIDHATTVMLLDKSGRIRLRVEGGGRQDFAAMLKNSSRL